MNFRLRKISFNLRKISFQLNTIEITNDVNMKALIDYDYSGDYNWIFLGKIGRDKYVFCLLLCRTIFFKYKSGRLLGHVGVETSTLNRQDLLSSGRKNLLQVPDGQRQSGVSNTAVRPAATAAKKHWTIWCIWQPNPQPETTLHARNLACWQSEGFWNCNTASSDIQLH